MEDREGVALFGVSVPDILNLEFRVSVDGKTHKGPFVMGQGTSVPIVLPFGPSKPVSKSQRDLVQIIYLSDTYTGGERALYQFIEASSEGVVSAGLGQQYRHIHVLKGDDATLAKFKSGANCRKCCRRRGGGRYVQHPRQQRQGALQGRRQEHDHRQGLPQWPVGRRARQMSAPSSPRRASVPRI